MFNLNQNVPADSSKLSDVVKNDVVTKDVYNVKIKNIENNTLHVTSLATNAFLNAKIIPLKVKYLILPN